MPNKQMTPEQEMARRSRRSFVGLGLGAAAMVGGWEWLQHQPKQDEVLAPLRTVLGLNERVVRKSIYGNGNLARSYPASAITGQKVNGEEGIEDPVSADWKLEVVPMGKVDPVHHLTLEDVKALPRFEQTNEFRCIEGWSAISEFAGARLSDFTAKFAPGSENAAYVGMRTPDEGYYVGIDMPSALHPQTLLAYEMNGTPLEKGHGEPLRLVIPVKYGIKNIKRIGRIFYSDERPADYWAEQGYDYYSGL